MVGHCPDQLGLYRSGSSFSPHFMGLFLGGYSFFVAYLESDNDDSRLDRLDARVALGIAEP
jgi:hypothetical protein